MSSRSRSVNVSIARMYHHLDLVTYERDGEFIENISGKRGLVLERPTPAKYQCVWRNKTSVDVGK